MKKADHEVRWKEFKNCCSNSVLPLLQTHSKNFTRVRNKDATAMRKSCIVTNVPTTFNTSNEAILGGQVYCSTVLTTLTISITITFFTKIESTFEETHFKSTILSDEKDGPSEKSNKILTALSGRTEHAEGDRNCNARLLNYKIEFRH
ncbi:Uncharacterised protein r2_g2475 [Pycnogonum litorale]